MDIFPVFFLFYFLSCQYPGNFIPMNQLDRWKKFWINCVMPSLLIFQTQRGHKDGLINKLSDNSFGAVTNDYNYMCYHIWCWYRRFVSQTTILLQCYRAKILL